MAGERRPRCEPLNLSGRLRNTQRLLPWCGVV